MFDIATVNVPLFLVMIFAFFYIKNISENKLFYFGLGLNLLAGVLAIPYSEWIFKNFSDLVQYDEVFLSLSILPIGFIDMVGLFLCVVAYGKAKNKQKEL